MFNKSSNVITVKKLRIDSYQVFKLSSLEVISILYSRTKDKTRYDYGILLGGSWGENKCIEKRREISISTSEK